MLIEVSAGDFQHGLRFAADPDQTEQTIRSADEAQGSAQGVEPVVRRELSHVVNDHDRDLVFNGELL
jgi:hypothetical protein